MIAPSEYDPLGAASEETEDLLRVREHFAGAAQPFVTSPWSWVAWAVVLPVASLLTRPVAGAWGYSGVLLLWSGAILAAGLVEALAIRRGRGRHGRSSLASWVLRAQGNLSLVALVLSAVMVVADQSILLPGLWLLLLGHSFYVVGGLAFGPFRPYGLAFQAAGVVALWPRLVDPFVVLAAVTFGANLWMAWKVRARRRASRRSSRSPDSRGWFGELEDHAREVERHDMEAIRESMARGIAAEREP